MLVSNQPRNFAIFPAFDVVSKTNSPIGLKVDYITFCKYCVYLELSDQDI